MVEVEEWRLVNIQTMYTQARSENVAPAFFIQTNLGPKQAEFVNLTLYREIFSNYIWKKRKYFPDRNNEVRTDLFTLDSLSASHTLFSY